MRMGVVGMWASSQSYDQDTNLTRLVPFELLPTRFVIGGDAYLAVANYHDAGNTGKATRWDTQSHVYKWEGGRFALFQSIVTSGAAYFKAFAIGADTYLAVVSPCVKLRHI